jgi:GNAT superfamily N-acetyltransferase
MDTKVNLRRASLGDMAELLVLIQDLADFEKASNEVITTVESMKKDFQTGLFDAIIAELDQKIIGMAIFYPAYSTWKGRMMYLEDLIVKEEYRSLGVGSALFSEVEKQSKSQGSVLMKWQVLDWNVDAVSFYEKKQAIIEKNWWNGKKQL